MSTDQCRAQDPGIKQLQKSTLANTHILFGCWADLVDFEASNMCCHITTGMDLYYAALQPWCDVHSHADRMFRACLLQVTALCVWLGEPANADPSAVLSTLWHFAISFDQAQRQFKGSA